jgi:carbon-monoxide dehydrogenase large subunit
VSRTSEADAGEIRARMIDPDHHRLLAGQGRYVDDERRQGALHMAVLRAPVAHGDIAVLETEAAAAMPGVRLVLTAADLAGVGPLVTRAKVEGMVEPRRPVLAEGRVLYVGQPVAAVVAETEAAALDALDAIALDIAERPAVIDVARAAEAQPIWAEAPENRAFAWERGNGDETARLIAGAAHVLELTVAHPRIAVAPIEPRGCLAEHDPATGRYTLTTPSQGVVALRTALCACLRLPPDRLRVLTHDVGGSFAVKIWPYPEHVLALVAARATGRPVRWTATRSDAFLGDVPGRARLDRGTLALDADGRFLAFRIDALADMGAFLNTAAPSIVTQGAVRPFAQLYRIPGQHYRVQAVFTNAHPTDAYRGAGKPESTATLERLIDVAARRLALDPLALREQNLIRPDELPLTTPMDETMDAGDFPAIARAIREAAGWDGLSARKAESAARGLLRGASIGFHLHATGGSVAERSEVRALPDGTVLVRTGAQDTGQSHRATLALVAAEALDLAPGRIRVEQGDSDRLETGGGTGGRT